jgi:hypothetical protein
MASGGGREHRLGGLGRARQRAPALLVAPEQGLEELAHHPEGELALELGPAGGQRAHPRRLGPAPGLAQQPGLADPRRALDEHQPRVTVGRLGHQPVDRPLLPIAVEQLRPRHAPAPR